jgi:hypothetical protein
MLFPSYALKNVKVSGRSRYIDTDHHYTTLVGNVLVQNDFCLIYYNISHFILQNQNAQDQTGYASGKTA